MKAGWGGEEWGLGTGEQRERVGEAERTDEKGKERVLVLRYEKGKEWGTGGAQTNGLARSNFRGIRPSGMPEWRGGTLNFKCDHYNFVW